MKTFKKIFGVAACIGILAASATSVFGQLIFTFDENGHGIFNGQTVPWTMDVEPQSGIPTLTYHLGLPTTPGDILLTESGPPGSPFLSDIVRFDAQGNVYFFSDSAAPPDATDLADVTALPNVMTPYELVAEQGSESYNYGVWGPVAGQPGFVVVAGAPIQYTIISDVPEPGSMLLLGLSGGLLLLMKFRRQPRRE